VAQSPSSGILVELGGGAGVDGGARGLACLAAKRECPGGLVGAVWSVCGGGPCGPAGARHITPFGGRDGERGHGAVFGWELAKILVSVALLLAAPRLVPGLSWLALLVGMVITMKAYWVALWVRSSVRATN